MYSNVSNNSRSSKSKQAHDLNNNADARSAGFGGSHQNAYNGSQLVDGAGLPDNDSSSHSMDSSGHERFDIDDPFKDMECTNVYVDEDEKERLPQFFNVRGVQKIKRDDCYLCFEHIGNLGKRRQYCSYCGKTVCKMCCQNKRILSKADAKPDPKHSRYHPVCDMCDHMLSNLLFKENLKTNMERKREACDDLAKGIAMLDEKIKNFAKLTKEQARISGKREEEIARQEM